MFDWDAEGRRFESRVDVLSRQLSMLSVVRSGHCMVGWRSHPSDEDVKLWSRWQESHHVCMVLWTLFAKRSARTWCSFTSSFIPVKVMALISSCCSREFRRRIIKHLWIAWKGHYISTWIDLFNQNTQMCRGFNESQLIMSCLPWALLKFCN